MTITENPPVGDAPSAVEAQHEDNLSLQTAGGEGAPLTGEPSEGEAPLEEVSNRVAVAIGFPVIAAAVLIGGVFTGVSPRIYTIVAGLLGVALAAFAARIRKAVTANVVVLLGLFLIGAVMVLPTGPGNIGELRSIVRDAAESGDVLRPPVPWTAGWAAITGWLMGITGFVAAWVALALRKPSIGLVIPLPVGVIAAISVNEAQVVATAIGAFVLFAIGLGLLASANTVGEEDERPPISYEIRKALKSLPVLAVIVALLVLASRSDFLFPKTLIDPAQEPQKPKTTPLSEVEDRVLFEVQSPITGPWRLGALDVYDGEDWRLPPFAENDINEVPRSGIVNDELNAGVQARFTIAGMDGAVLPGLPNITGIVAEGPKLAYDERNGNIRVAQGQIRAGLVYAVTAAALPKIEDLQAIQTEWPPREQARFAEMPDDPPPAVQALIDQAPTTSKWDQFDFLRTWILDNIVASGAGVPRSITPERLQEMIGTDKKGTPYEIVAAQAMLARWIDLPARIGYGFDGGEQVGDRLQVRPENGASFVEVFFPNYGWLPVIGTPKQAQPSVGSESTEQQFDPTIQASNEVAVELYLPVLTPADSIFYEQLRNALLIILPILLLLGLAYVLWPAIRKWRIRGKRRAAAERAGPRSRIALAYSDWRDFATDFGYDYSTDTPLMFLDRFVEDAEHTELAWLVTRALWGDLQTELTNEHAAIAEELSKALRRRLAQAQPFTVRAVAAVSRLSLRHPYAPETDLTRRGRRVMARVEEERKEAEVVSAGV